MSELRPKLGDHLIHLGAIACFLAFALYATLSAVVPRDDFPHATCVFRLLTERPCPLCGTTRSVHALARGELLESLKFQPFMLFYTGLLSWGAVASAVAICRSTRFRLPTAVGVLTAACLIVGWALKFLIGREYW